MNNIEFINILKKAFDVYLNQESGSRSTAKLKGLHGSVVKDVQSRLGDDYIVLGQDEIGGREVNFLGRYTPKNVDIGVVRKKDGKQLASIEIKFVMQNYKQNSINYFYGMLGETANLRCNNIMCFQIFICLEFLPYFKNAGGHSIKNIEQINLNNLDKYIKLSIDDTNKYFHSPNKTLIFIINNPQITEELIGKSRQQYKDRLTGATDEFEIAFIETASFGDGVVVNDYEKFMNKITHQIKGI